MKAVERYYDQLSIQYDEATSADGAWRAPGKVATTIAEVAGLHLDWLVVGVGTGQDIPAVLAKAPNHVESIDISGSMIAIAHRKYPDLVFHHGDFMRFEQFTHASYDVIVCSGVLEFICDLPSFLRKCNRLFADAGTLIVTFEPIIEGYGQQGEATSSLATEEVVGFDIFGLRLFRNNLLSFLVEVESAAFRLTKLDSFVSFVRSRRGVIYNLAVLQKVSPDD